MTSPADFHEEECAETYQACMAARRQRLTRLMDEHPNASKSELARLAGVTSSTIDHYRALNRRAAEDYAPPELHEFEETIAEGRERINVRGTTGTGFEEWHTPELYLTLARQVLGTIDLDPASSALAQQAVRATSFYTVADNGLTKPWRGRIWLNPPYTQPAIALFMKKLRNEDEADNIKAAIALTHNYTDTEWFQETAEVATAICFTRGRIRFINPRGEVASPTQGQAFFYFGQDHELFTDVFEEIGFVR